MSIKFLGDNQLNQIQNSPNDSPWAKLIAQAEMLDRNKLRQPQGQAPQGTVASNIQQQLLNDQMQAYDKSQNADAAKAQLLAQLMGSGHIQGMAVGGSAVIPPLSMSKSRYLSGAKQAVQDYLASEHAPSDAYSEILSSLGGRGMADGGSAIASPLNTPAPMMGPSPINPAKPEQTQTVPLGNSTLSVDDPNKKAKQHDIFQRLIDNSIIGAIQGKGSFGESLQLYSDMFTGKALQGLAEGGEVRRFTEGGSLFEQLQRIKAMMGDAQHAKQGWTPEAIENYKSAYAPNMQENMSRRNLVPSGQSTPSFEDIAQAQARLRAQTGLDITNPDTIRMPPYSERVTIPEAAPSQGMQTSGNRGFGAAPQGGPAPEYIPAGRPDIAGLLPKEGKVYEGASFEHPTSTPRADAAYAQADYAERAANRGYQPMTKAAADYTAEEAAQAARFAEAKRAAEKFSGPMKPGALSTNVADMQAAEQFANQMINRPESEYQHPELKSKLQGMFGGAEDAAPREWVGKALHMFSGDKGWHAPMQLPDERTATPGANPTITEQSKAPVKPPITKDNVVAVAKAHNYDKQQSQVLDAIQKEAALNQTQQAISKTAGEDSTESMYRQLKDADLDYAELAKRISENEKDLARERKDGTLTSIISGIGAALTEAGNYKQVGDRVFRPSAAGVIGAGVLGGLGTSEALEKEYRTGISKNLDALATLQSLKRQSRNDVMDAINAENQNKMMAQHYGVLEDIAKQKLPGEMALTNAQTGMYTAHAGAYNRAGAGASDSAGKPLTQAQRAGIYNAASDDVMKMLTKDNDYLLMSPADQAALVKTKTEEEYLKRLAKAGSIGSVSQPEPSAVPEVDKWAGYKKVTG